MEKSDFLFASTIQLLKDRHKLQGNQHKVEERVPIANTSKPSKSVKCYVNKIDAVKSSMEVCDQAYSI